LHSNRSTRTHKKQAIRDIVDIRKTAIFIDMFMCSIENALSYTSVNTTCKHVEDRLGITAEHACIGCSCICSCELVLGKEFLCTFSFVAFCDWKNWHWIKN